MQFQQTLSDIKPLLRTTWVRRLALAGGAIAAGYWMWNGAAIFTVGSGSLPTKYSYSDVESYYKADSRVASIMGTPAIESRRQAFVYLALAGLEKEILKAKDINVVKDNAVAVVENRTALKGLMGDIKKKIGADRYYRVVVEPLVISELFAGYYRVNDPNRKVAEKILADAATAGIDAAGQAAGYQAKEMAIPMAPANGAFIEESKQYVGRLFPKMLEDGSGYSVAQVKELRQGAVIVNAVFVPRKPIYEFIKDELKNNAIPLSFRPYSVYRESDLVKAFTANQKTGDKGDGKADTAKK